MNLGHVSYYREDELLILYNFQEAISAVRKSIIETDVNTDQRKAIVHKLIKLKIKEQDLENRKFFQVLLHSSWRISNRMYLCVSLPNDLAKRCTYRYDSNKLMRLFFFYFFLLCEWFWAGLCKWHISMIFLMINFYQ